MAEATDTVRVLTGVRINGEHKFEGDEVETNAEDAALVVGLGKAEYTDPHARVIEVAQAPATLGSPESPLAVHATNPRTTTAPTERTEYHDPHTAAPAETEQANFNPNTTEQPGVRTDVFKSGK